MRATRSSLAVSVLRLAIGSRRGDWGLANYFDAPSSDGSAWYYGVKEIAPEDVWGFDAYAVCANVG
jgi:hypothetical protein